MPIQVVTSDAQIPEVAVGTYLRRMAAQPRVRGRERLVVGVIGAAPWGPAEAWTTIDGGERGLIETFFPFGSESTTMSEILNLPWGPLKFWNVRGSSPVAATVTLDDASAGDSMVITARYTGAGGNRIKYAVTANATTATSRDVRIYVEDINGDVMWDETYLAVQVSNGTVTDPGDPWVTIAAASGATGPAAATSGTLSSGSNGTIAASDYRQALDAAAGDAGIDILVCAGVASGTVADVRTTMTTWAATSAADDAVCAVLPTAAAASVSSAISAIDSYRHRKLRAVYPRMVRQVTYNYRGFARTWSETVDGAPTLACIIQNAGPTRAAFQAAAYQVAPGALAPITGLEAGYTGLTPDNKNDLMAAGINAWHRSRSFGNAFVPFAGVTTYLDANDIPARDHDERYYEYVARAIALTAEARAGEPLDVKLAEGILGPSSAALIGAIEAFLQGEKSAGRITTGLNSDGTSSPAFAVDPFSAASQEELSDNRWTIVVSYRQTPNTEMVVLRLNAGTSVDIIPAE